MHICPIHVPANIARRKMAMVQIRCICTLAACSLGGICTLKIDRTVTKQLAGASRKFGVSLLYGSFNRGPVRSEC